jgi:hypothetical protein
MERKEEALPILSDSPVIALADAFYELRPAPLSTLEEKIKLLSAQDRVLLFCMICHYRLFSLFLWVQSQRPWTSQDWNQDPEMKVARTELSLSAEGSRFNLFLFLQEEREKNKRLELDH